MPMGPSSASKLTGATDENARNRPIPIVFALMLIPSGFNFLFVLEQALGVLDRPQHRSGNGFAPAEIAAVGLERIEHVGIRIARSADGNGIRIPFDGRRAWPVRYPLTERQGPICRERRRNRGRRCSVPYDRRQRQGDSYCNSNRCSKSFQQRSNLGSYSCGFAAHIVSFLVMDIPGSAARAHSSSVRRNSGEEGEGPVSSGGAM